MSRAKTIVKASGNAMKEDGAYAIVFRCPPYLKKLRKSKSRNEIFSFFSF